MCPSIPQLKQVCFVKTINLGPGPDEVDELEFEFCLSFNNFLHAHTQTSFCFSIFAGLEVLAVKSLDFKSKPSSFLTIESKPSFKTETSKTAFLDSKSKSKQVSDSELNVLEH